MTPRFFAWFTLGSLACLVSLGIGRATVLYARGVHVVAVDRQRSLWQGLADLLSVVLFLVWGYETVAHSWPLQGHVCPVLGTVLVDSMAAKLVGVAIELAGLTIFACALWAFADSWRIGIDRDAAGALVTGGIFAWTRNPIYIALDLLIFGSFLLVGRAIFLALALALIGLLHFQIRREEVYLTAAYGDAYRAYCARVGRYLTWR